MKYLFLLSFALIINMHPAYAQSKSLAAEVAATAMATLWKVPVGADTAKPTKWTYGQSIGLLGISRLWIQTANPAYFSYLQNRINYFISENGGFTGNIANKFITHCFTLQVDFLPDLIHFHPGHWRKEKKLVRRIKTEELFKGNHRIRFFSISRFDCSAVFSFYYISCHITFTVFITDSIKKPLFIC
jgi:hypothetical protein